MKNVAIESATDQHGQGRDSQSITRLLIACGEGDRTAFDLLVSLVYPEMRRIARRQLGRLRPGNTLATTGLVHEAYLKLHDQRRMEWNNQHHFYSIAACAMRQLLVDNIKRRQAGKRDGIATTLNEEQLALSAPEEAWILGLDDALKELESLDATLSRVVECLFFAGLTQEETAQALGVSAPTVSRKWQRARAWLHTELAADA